MILVFADDLSGAAELAGIAASFGLKAEVATQGTASSKAQLLAIDTQTRDLSSDDAAKQCAQIYEQTAALNPDWIYKKTDSALRGNIRAELLSFSQSTGRTHILFIPANPQKNRCILNGSYAVDGIPLHRSIFAQDPEHPITTSKVAQEIRRETTFPIHCPKAKEPGETQGWVIPDISTREDIEFRIREVTANTLPAGAAEFFTALLGQSLPTTHSPVKATLELDSPRLLVSGSLASWDQGIETSARQHNVSSHLLQDKDTWISKTRQSLERDGMAVMAIGQAAHIKIDTDQATSQDQLLSPLVESATAIIRRDAIDTLLIEGGATATALIQQMGWTQFDVVPSPLEGTGCLIPKPSDRKLKLVIKPGSYPWPSAIWQDLAPPNYSSP